MSRSSVDINNPCYEKSIPSPRFQSGSFEDVLEGFSLKVEYDFFDYAREIHVVKLVVVTNYDGLYLEEIVLDRIALDNGRNIAKLETKMEIV